MTSAVASAPAAKSQRANGRSVTNGVADHGSHANGQPARRARTQRSVAEKKTRTKEATNGIAAAAGFDADDAKGMDGGLSPAPSEREATVLDAVRFLVRATAGEIAQRCGLPNGTVYVVLRSLVASDQVAKTATARGIEYSLVSSGGIRPFKRASASTGQTEPPPPPAGAPLPEAQPQASAASAAASN